MGHVNMVMRDPLLLRIRHAHHYRRGNDWCIYPLYDFAHGLSDAIEGITRLLCTLEFADAREIYDWLVHEAGFVNPPTQIEFARLELDYTVLSKRKLLRLVNEGHVSGWDDPACPRLPGCVGVACVRRPFVRLPKRSVWHARMRGWNTRRTSMRCATT